MKAQSRARKFLTGMLVLTSASISACADDGLLEPDPSTAADAPGLPATSSASKQAVPLVTMGTDELHKGLATLRRVTARYHRVDAAIGDGFIQAGSCFDPPGPGAVGIPYVRLDRFDATIDLEKPEVLFYEPRKNGMLRLVGVETVVPIAAWTGEEPPSLFGHEFHRNEDHGLYGLHLWVWRRNPAGVFAFAHPRVSCGIAAPIGP